MLYSGLSSWFDIRLSETQFVALPSNNSPTFYPLFFEPTGRLGTTQRHQTKIQAASASLYFFPHRSRRRAKEVKKKINVITHVHSEVRTTTNFTNPDSQLGLEPREVAPSESNDSRLSPVRTEYTSHQQLHRPERKEKKKKKEVARWRVGRFIEHWGYG